MPAMSVPGAGMVFFMSRGSMNPRNLLARLALVRIAPFLFWLMCFYAGWLAVIVAGDHWVTLREHWGIAAAMAAGSYVAGSTPMGGGTVGFPILVLLFDQSASIGRNFSFAVQSVGMVSATIFILCLRRPLEWSMLRAAMIGALIGTPIGAAFLAPIANDLTVKLIFAVIWASFGVMHLVKVHEIVRVHGITPSTTRFDTMMGLGVGLLGGGCIASLTGVGIDMLIYTMLILVSRADIKIAIPTSVVLMAFTSLVGLASNLLLQRVDPVVYHVDTEVFHSWLAAAPIVALGAPLGAFMVAIIPRGPTLVFVSVLCIVQFIWTLVHESVGWITLGIAIGGVLFCNAAFHALYRWGARRQGRLGRHLIVE